LAIIPLAIIPLAVIPLAVIPLVVIPLVVIPGGNLLLLLLLLLPLPLPLPLLLLLLLLLLLDPTPNSRHLDRSDGQHHRPSRSGETPALVFAVALAFASEIGPGFSPGTRPTTKAGLQLLGYGFPPAST